ncbi:hypothetical protein [Ottowia thiooxydans]|uniref:hypothetical protein n=1 Tax=Ottowia thiooxydans TaxID=219182 RepID=UPI00040997C6|nr:hypothetical protein [Ottowia thiooxydans]
MYLGKAVDDKMAKAPQQRASKTSWVARSIQTAMCAVMMSTPLVHAQLQAPTQAEASSVWPSVAEAQVAIAALMAKRAPNRTVKVERVLGCLPGFKEKPGVWVCPVIHAGSERPLEWTLVRQGSQWIARDDDAKPACAPLKVVEAAFRQRLSNQKLRVTGEVDDGEGLFTSDRGITRSERGPFRLMCRYEVDTGFVKEALFLTYVWHDGQKYLIDSDVERW